MPRANGRRHDRPCQKPRRDAALNLTQVGSAVNAHVVHLLQSLLAYAPKIFHGQLRDKVESLVGVNGADAVGLAIVGSHLGEKLAIADTCRCGESCLCFDACLDFACHIYSQLYTFLIMGDIEKGLVDGDRFYEVGIILEDVVNLLRHLFIMFVSARHDVEVGAEALGLCD